MPDYNKLTVVKLREELVRRGLPKTGLKPVLVNRLLEADAQIEIQNATPDVSLSDVPAVRDELHAQVQPSHSSQTQRTQDTGGADTKLVHAHPPEHKISKATENGSLQEREPLEKASGTIREDERSSDAPSQLESQPSAAIPAVTAVEKVAPDIGAFLTPLL